MPPTRFTILVPPAVRAEFIVQAPPQNNEAIFIALGYSTGPTGNPDLEQQLGAIRVSADAEETPETAQVPKEESAEPAARVPSAQPPAKGNRKTE